MHEWLTKFADLLTRLPEAARKLRRQNRLPIRRRFRHAFGPLMEQFMKPTEWLSHSVPSVEAIRAERLTRPADVIEDRRQARHLWGHRYKNNILCAVPILVVLVTSSVTVGALYDHFCGANTEDEFHTAILTIAAVLASITGLLFVAMIFGMEFHANRLGNAHFLVRYLGRGAAVVPTVSLSLTVVAANAMVGAISMLGFSRASQVMAIWDIILVPSVFWLTFRLFHSMVIGISGDFFGETLLPALSSEYARRLDRQAHYSLMSLEFEKFAENCGAEVSTWYPYITHDEDEHVGYGIPGKGLVYDVNLTSLSRLLTLVHDTAPGCRVVLSAGPDDSPNGGPILWITTAPKDLADSLSGEGRSLPIDITVPVELYLQRIFKLQKPEVSDLLEVLRQFEEVLIHQSEHATCAQFGRCLNVYKELFLLNLSHPKRMSLHDSNCFLYGLGDTVSFFDMAKKVVESDNDDKIKTLTNFAFALMASAVEHRETSLIGKAGQIIEAVYWQAIRRKETANEAAERVDRLMNSVTSQLKSFRMLSDTRKKAPDELREIREVLGWILRILRIAIDADRKEDAVNFLDRIVMNRTRVYAGPLTDAAAARVENVQTYALILAASYAIRQLHLSQSTETCIAVIEKIVTKTSGRSRLLHAWEDQEEPSEGGGIITADLWPRTEGQHRVGIVESSWLDTEWVFRGFIALLLSNSRKPWCHSEQLTADSFKSSIPDDHAVLTACNTAFANPILCKQALGISEDKRDERTKIVQDMFSKQRKVVKLEGLRKIVKTEVSVERIEALRTSTEEHLETHRIWAEIFRQLGDLKEPATAALHEATRLTRSIWKEALIPAVGSDYDFGSSLSLPLGDTESHVIVAKLLKLAPEISMISDLRNMPDELRRIIAELRAGGYVPNMIILPQPYRFSNVLFGVPHWQIPKDNSLFGPHLNKWEDCEVFTSPFIDPDGILVLDTCKLFGVTENGLDPQVSLEIINDNAAAHKDILRKAESAPDDSEFPNTTDLTVRTSVTLLPSIGICDPKAIAKLSLDLSGVGYGQCEGDDLYHRPNCPKIAAKEVTHSLDPGVGSN